MHFYRANTLFSFHKFVHMSIVICRTVVALNMSSIRDKRQADLLEFTRISADILNLFCAKFAISPNMYNTIVPNCKWCFACNKIMFQKFFTINSKKDPVCEFLHYKRPALLNFQWKMMRNISHIFLWIELTVYRFKTWHPI